MFQKFQNDTIMIIYNSTKQSEEINNHLIPQFLKLQLS